MKRILESIPVYYLNNIASETPIKKNDQLFQNTPVNSASNHAILEGVNKWIIIKNPINNKEIIINMEQVLNATPQTQKRVSKSDAFLSKLRSVIDNNISESDFDVPQFAREMLMSQVQLYRKVKSLTGKTPSQYIRSIRLEKASELLKHSDLNISEIAYEVGFNDPNYFTRIFQKAFGKPPRVIRLEITC